MDDSLDNQARAVDGIGLSGVKHLPGSENTKEQVLKKSWPRMYFSSQFSKIGIRPIESLSHEYTPPSTTALISLSESLISFSHA